LKQTATCVLRFEMRRATSRGIVVCEVPEKPQWCEIRNTVFGWTRTRFPLHIRSTRALNIRDNARLVTVIGKASWDIGDAPKDQSNRRKRLPDSFRCAGDPKAAPTKPDNTQACHIEIRYLDIVLLPHPRFRNGKFTKEAISIMKPKRIFNSILAVLFVFPLMGAFAQQAANSGSIEVITTFDYPGTGNLTLPQKINERGDIVGEFIDPNGVTRGFVRFSNGSFSAPIVDPNDTVGFTEGRGINNSRTVVGDYASSDGNIHSFFLSGDTFTEYDVPGAATTVVLGINDAGDFTGGFDPGSGIFQGFIGRGGTITSFNVPAAISTLAYEDQ
jgi:hypothetical protein